MTTPLKPPTNLRGYVDDQLGYGSILTDFADTVPDCLWPTSNETYRQMRRHPPLAAILAAYSLPIRRATWAVNPAGCRPEVAQLVADDLGLPVAGIDQPGAARVRGVSWAEHLRMALLTLPFGHIGFELLAEIRDGRARLVELSERMPHTITEIHTDKVGRFTGISQDALAPATKSPQISADRMLWYAREREGASWWGSSLLRPAYPAWLLSREMLRVAATSSRRFGMGVPTVEWAAGTNPTPAQHTEALAAASAARVGDQSGLVLPPGAVLALKGLEGSAPDTLGLIRYLDQQSSRMCLAGFLDLGSTETGSRALSESFIDLFTLSIQSEALMIADTVTRQVAARLVEWNFGPGEPVPAVQVSDVGAKHDVTAESLKLLMDSGALSADPGLEAHVRRAFRLPEREQAPALPPAPPPSPPPTPSAAKARPRARREPAGQMALPIMAAATPQPDLAAIQEQWVQAKADLLAAWPDASQPMVDELAAQVEAAVEAEDLGALGTLAVSAATLATVTALIGDAGATTAALSAGNVISEAAAQGVTVTAPDDAGGVRSRQVAEAVAGVIASGYATGAARAALKVAGNGDGAGVAVIVREHLTELSASEKGFVADGFGAVLSAAQNAGRLAVLEVAPTATYRAVESNDSNSCAACKSISGVTFESLDEATAAYPGGSYVSCAGSLRCRGFIFPSWD